MTSCSPAVERKKHTQIHTHIKITTERISGSQAHTNIHTACSAQPKCREVPRTLLGPLFLTSLFLSCPPHTFRSTSLVPLEQVMTIQEGSAAMATPSATSSCSPQLQSCGGALTARAYPSLRHHHPELMELEVPLDCSHLITPEVAES